MVNPYKFNKIRHEEKGSKKYFRLFLGEENWLFFLKYEFILMLCSWLPGTLGFFLRSKLYPFILGHVGAGVVFGRNIMLRHPRKIKINAGTIIDDGCVLDAKGGPTSGISIGKNCYIGRNTIIYCKDGYIRIDDESNVGHNCIIFSSNLVEIKKRVLIAAFSYIMSGGQYEFPSEKDFVLQDTFSVGPTIIESNTWVGTKVVIVDGVRIGKNSIIGAGSIVLKSVPQDCVVYGLPGKVRRFLKEK